MTIFANCKSHKVRPTIGDPCAQNRNAIGAGRKHKTATLSTWDVKGYISGEWMELRVSAIAKQYGGGGHRNASGFKVPLAEISQFEIA